MNLEERLRTYRDELDEAIANEVASRDLDELGPARATSGAGLATSADVGTDPRAPRRRRTEPIAALAAVIIVVGVSVGAVVALRSNSTATRRPTTPPVELRLSSAPNVTWAMGEVVDALRKKCSIGVDRVELNLVAGGKEQVHGVFTCVDVREPADKVEALLVRSVSGRRQAVRRADRILAFDRQLGVAFDIARPQLIWLLGSESSEFSCDKAADVNFRRGEIHDAGVEGENPTHWLKVEAAFIAGACPSRLEVLYETVIRAGQPQAVATVSAELPAR
jgi:hypothetical protein